MSSSLPSLKRPFTDGHFVEKAGIPGRLKAVGMPYALFYTGAFADFIWDAYVVSLGFHRFLNSR
jgi:hypothetical protein